VRYTEFIRAVRENALKIGERGTCAHGGIISSIMRIMTKDITQNRLGWISEDLKTSKNGEFLYFVGCLPYFDRIFEDIGANSLDIAKSTIKILNHVGITPVVMGNERCCGHDFLWTGDTEKFEKLAKLNVDMIKNTGAKKVIFSCPECYRTFKFDYPDHIGGLNFEVIHISEFLTELIEEGKIEFGEVERKVTYHDSCRLGRHLGIYDPPREIITSIPGIKLVEMDRNRSNAVCCGTSAWTNCDMISEEMQMERLKEAKESGADTLITTCPKCQIHFKCGMSRRQDAEIEIEDLSILVANAIMR
jgi:Fe-S oxidoreductase